MDGDEIEMVEEDTVGQIVQGEDGEYYVVVDDAAPDVGGYLRCYLILAIYKLIPSL